MSVSRAVFASLLTVAIAGRLLSVAAQGQTAASWTPFKSCIDLTNRLDPWIKTAEPTASALQVDFWDNKTLSQHYFTHIQGREVLIFQTPQSPSQKQLNLQQAKLRSRITLPKAWTEIRAEFLSNDFLIIVARHQNQQQVLIYQRDQQRLQQQKNLIFELELKAVRLLNDKLLFISETPLTQQRLSSRSREQGASKLFPALQLSKRYGSEELEVIQPTCKQIQHQLLDNRLPNWYAVLAFSTNDLQKSPDVSYYLGNIDQISFGKNYFFWTQKVADTSLSCTDCLAFAEEGKRSIVQRFLLEPRVFQKGTAVLSGEAFPVIAADRQTDAHPLLLQQESGATKQYSFLEIDELFQSITTKNAVITKENFDALIDAGKTIYLQKEKKSDLFPVITDQLGVEPVQLSVNRRLRGKDPFSNLMLELTQTGEQVAFNLYQLSASAPKLLKSHLLGEGKLLEKAYWDAEKWRFAFWLKSGDRLLLLGYQLDKEGQLSPVYKRDYSKIASQQLPKVYLGTERVMIVSERYADIFLRKNHRQTRLLRLP